MNYCLGRVKEEIAREVNKALLKIPDLAERNVLVEQLNLHRFRTQAGEAGPEDIIVVADMKEGKRPQPRQSVPGHAKKSKTGPAAPAPGAKADEIDDIFGF